MWWFSKRNKDSKELLPSGEALESLIASIRKEALNVPPVKKIVLLPNKDRFVDVGTCEVLFSFIDSNIKEILSDYSLEKFAHDYTVRVNWILKTAIYNHYVWIRKLDIDKTFRAVPIDKDEMKRLYFTHEDRVVDNLHLIMEEY